LLGAGDALAAKQEFAAMILRELPSTMPGTPTVRIADITSDSNGKLTASVDIDASSPLMAEVYRERMAVMWQDPSSPLRSSALGAAVDLSSYSYPSMQVTAVETPAGEVYVPPPSFVPTLQITCTPDVVVQPFVAGTVATLATEAVGAALALPLRPIALASAAYAWFRKPNASL